MKLGIHIGTDRIQLLNDLLLEDRRHLCHSIVHGSERIYLNPIDVSWLIGLATVSELGFLLCVASGDVGSIGNEDTSTNEVASIAELVVEFIERVLRAVECAFTTEWRRTNGVGRGQEHRSPVCTGLR